MNTGVPALIEQLAQSLETKNLHHQERFNKIQLSKSIIKRLEKAIKNSEKFER